MQTVHPQYASKAALILAFTLADLAINTIADHDDYTFHGNWYLAVLFSVQAVIQVVNFLMLFLILVGTFLFQVGLLSELAAQFKPFLFAALAYLAALLAYGGVKMHLVLNEGVNRLEAWDHPAFYALFVLHKMIAPLYYVALLHAVMTLGHPKWYSRAVWVSKFQAV